MCTSGPGSATAETSATARLEPQPTDAASAVCQAAAASNWLQPLLVWFQATLAPVRAGRRQCQLRTADGEDDRKRGGKRRRESEGRVAAGGDDDRVRSCVVARVLSVRGAARDVEAGDDCLRAGACRRRGGRGQVAGGERVRLHQRDRAALANAARELDSNRGLGDERARRSDRAAAAASLTPDWLSTRKQPFATVHAPIPNRVVYAFRSACTCGSS